MIDVIYWFMKYLDGNYSTLKHLTKTVINDKSSRT